MYPQIRQDSRDPNSRGTETSYELYDADTGNTLAIYCVNDDRGRQIADAFSNKLVIAQKRDLERTVAIRNQQLDAQGFKITQLLHNVSQLRNSLKYIVAAYVLALGAKIVMLTEGERNLLNDAKELCE